VAQQLNSLHLPAAVAVPSTAATPAAGSLDFVRLHPPADGNSETSGSRLVDQLPPEVHRTIWASAAREFQRLFPGGWKLAGWRRSAFPGRVYFLKPTYL